MNLSNLSFPILVGHRGYKQKYPENTMVSFHAAVSNGAGMLELDIRPTCDQRFAVIHDGTLERTSNGSGSIKQLTLEQIGKVDAGEWFDSRFQGEKIVSLEEVFQAFKGKVPINVEVKFDDENQPVEQLLEMAANLIRLIHDQGMLESVVVSSFSRTMLQAIQQQDKSIHLGFLTRQESFDDILEFCKSINAYSWHASRTGVTPSEIATMKAQGLRVFVYTVNQQSEVTRLSQAGADGIITDDLTLSLSIART